MIWRGINEQCWIRSCLLDSIINLSFSKVGSIQKVKYHLYDDQERHQGTFDSIEKLRNFLCDRKYDTNCDKDIGSTFDYIKHIKWFFEIEE